MTTQPVANGDGIKIGDRAPAFALAAINRDGDIGLADYIGREALLLGLFRGLHCPFCRRQVAQMNRHGPRLAEIGVTQLAVINADLARAKAYYGRLGFTMPLAADPDWDTHRRYGMARARTTLGKTQWPEKVNPIDMMKLTLGPSEDAPEITAPTSMMKAGSIIDKAEGYKPRLADKAGQLTQGLTSAGYTLIDRDGLIRWRWVEGQTGFDDFFKFPTAATLTEAITKALRI
jgi:peroxiredoxin